MPKCTIGHEIQTARGFKVFEQGVEYDPTEVGDRTKYFEATPEAQPEPVPVAYPSETAAEKASLKRRGKINEEVEADDAE